MRLACLRWALAYLCAGPALAQPLSVCVAQDNPPQSQVRQGRASGLDIRIAQALAQASGRELQLLPFETEFEKESTLAHEVNALLSAGLCELASGFPLLASDLGPPSRPHARVPDHPGAKRKRERPFIALGSLVASLPYQASTLAVVQGSGQAPVERLTDLRDRRIGAVTGTLTGTLVSLYGGGMLRGHMVTLSQRENAWAALESGRIDSLLVPTAAYDAHRLAHPHTPLVLAAWRRPLGVNLGFVALTSAAPELLAQTNQLIAQALADGRMAQWAREEGLSWSPPSGPAISAGPSLHGLSRD